MAVGASLDPPSRPRRISDAVRSGPVRALILLSAGVHAAPLLVPSLEESVGSTELAVAGVGVALAALALASRARPVVGVADTGSLHAQVEASDRRLRALLRHAADVVLLVEDDGLVTYASDSVISVFEIPAASLTGRPFRDLFGPNAPVIERAFAQVGDRPGLITTAESEIAVGRDRRRVVEVRVANQLHDAGVGGYVVHVTDVTALRKTERELEFQAGHDALTGLANRSRLSAVLAGAAADAGSRRTTYAVVFADLNLFKQVNDRYGHDVGDEVLRICADRLRQAVRAGDVAVRYGGDEFVVICPGADGAAAEGVARRIWESFHRPMAVSIGSVQVGVSLGIALGPTPSGDPEEPLRQADAAMYRMKHSRRS